MTNHNQKQKDNHSNIIEKAFIAWLKYDPFVAVVVKRDDNIRRDVMLNLLGKKAAERHFGKFPPRQSDYGPILPTTVRKTVDKLVRSNTSRDELINKLIYWATDPVINNRYLNSHQTRIQIVSSLLGPIFFHATPQQEENICKGLKYMLVHKKTVIDVPGEQSYEVTEILLGRIKEILIHNQKVIINKAVGEAEEIFRIHLLRQIQDLRGEKLSTPFYIPEMKSKVRKIIRDKFPLCRETEKHFAEILEFLTASKWPEIAARAKDAQKQILEIRKPLTLTSEDNPR